MLDSRPKGLSCTQLGKSTRVSFSYNLVAKLLLICLLTVPTNAGCSDRLCGKGNVVQRLIPLLIVLGICSCLITYLVVSHLPHRIQLADQVPFTNFLTENAFHALADPLNAIGYTAAGFTGLGIVYGIWLCAYNFAGHNRCSVYGYDTAMLLTIFSIVSVIIVPFLIVHGSSITTGLPMPGYHLSDIFNTNNQIVTSAASCWSLIPVVGAGAYGAMKVYDVYKEQNPASAAGNRELEPLAGRQIDHASDESWTVSGYNSPPASAGSAQDDNDSMMSGISILGRRRLISDSFKPFLRTALELNQVQAMYIVKHELA